MTDQKKEPTRYTGEDGIVAEVQDDLKLIVTTPCFECSASLKVPLKAIRHRVMLVQDPDADRDRDDNPSDFQQDVYEVECPVPYCKAMTPINTLSDWAKRAIRSGYFERLRQA